MIRCLDFIFSLLAIIAFSPLLIFCIIVLKLTGEGEIFYFQKRIGKEEKPFGLIKFVTMLKDSEKMGSGTLTIRNDPRVLPFGKFLRISKINELPQLFNILKGDMSVIGPRPLLSKQFFMYKEEDRKIISSVRPGLSGLGSIVFRDEEELLSQSNDPHKFYQDFISPYKAYLERWFVDNLSLFLYFKLIFITIIAIVFKLHNPLKLINSKLYEFDDFKNL